MVADKKRDCIYPLLPKDAVYYFTKPSIPRALDEHILAEEASAYGLMGRTYTSVRKAIAAARRNAQKKDFIYIGGSTFVVADAL